MERHKILKEEIENEKVAELLTILRDENFGNDDQRKRFIDIMSSLLNVKDKDARKVFKRVGNFFTDLGNEMLAPAEDENEHENEPENEPEENNDEMKESKRYKKRFPLKEKTQIFMVNVPEKLEVLFRRELEFDSNISNDSFEEIDNGSDVDFIFDGIYFDFVNEILLQNREFRNLKIEWS